MANKDENISRSLNRVNKRLDSLNDRVNKAYQDTYSSRVDNRNDLESISNKIDDDLNTLLSKVNGQEISDISNLYVRLKNKERSGVSDSQQQVYNSIEEMFDSNQQFMDTIAMDAIRKSIQAHDYQIDLICKYMTKLEDAIDIKKDSVLSSDNFTKEFLNVITSSSSKIFIDTFNDRATNIKDKYDVQELFEDMYYKASKYGEYFLYQVPYHRAFQRLLQRKQRFGQGIHWESGDVLFEAASTKMENTSITDQKLYEEMVGNDMKVKVIFDDTGIVPEPIQFLKEAYDTKNKIISLSESWTSNDKQIFKEYGETKVSEALSFDDGDQGIGANDGIFTAGKLNAKIKEDIPGTVMYEIPRANIIPIYMNDTAVGYIYIKVANNYVDNMVMNGNTYNSLTTNLNIMADEFDKQNDLLVSDIAAMMAEKIDAKFINSNLDLKEQIYAVLRYNEYFCSTHGTNMITVSFLPVEDVHHFYFKLDKKTHRGISDLDKSIIPAMIYCLLYLNTTIGQIGRSQDKRVYYVKQNVEQNVAKTLLNVVTQLKKGNMGMRQLENMNTIFNVIGRYNDHIIPESQSGDPPIRMEVMQGQQIDTPTELMEKMEDMAVTATDVPLEFINSVNSVDYAARFTMSNSKFLRKIYKRQQICQKHFTVIFRKLYNWEYGENDSTMKIVLPTPAFLAMTNSQQLLDNVKNYATTIADIMLATEEDENVKQEFINLYMRSQLGTYIDFSQVDDMITQARLNVELNKNNNMGAEETGDY